MHKIKLHQIKLETESIATELKLELNLEEIKVFANKPKNRKKMPRKKN